MVRKDFKEFIETDPSVPSELRRALKLNERTPKFVDNLCRELAIAEGRGIKMDRIKIKTTVHDLGAWFVGLMKTKANEQALSDLKRSAIKKETSKSEEMELYDELADEAGNADLSDEIGVEITDKR